MVNTPSNSMRVLVVDDEDLTRQVTERAFKKFGYAVTAAGDGPQALAKIEESATPFDLFVLDVMMPGMRGTELAERIRQRYPAAKILYLTGYSDTLFLDGRRSLGANEAFLEKPSSLTGLAEAASLLLCGRIGNVAAQ